jgi:hypothetical protein
MSCSNEQFILNLIEVNKRAKVDPELIDLIAAYVRLCLRYGKEVTFYDENPAPIKSRTVKKLIEKNAGLDKRSLSFLIFYAEMMRKRGLPFIFNNAHLADFLGLSDVELQRLIKVKDEHYHSFYIPKNNGGRRLISAPADYLKDIQKNILRSILDRVPIHLFANGFKRKRSIITNAANHAGHEIVIKMDIKDFWLIVKSCG